MCHKNRSIVAAHLSKVRQSATVIEVEMTDYQTVYVFCERSTGLCYVGEIREPSLQIITQTIIIITSLILK